MSLFRYYLFGLVFFLAFFACEKIPIFEQKGRGVSVVEIDLSKITAYVKGSSKAFQSSFLQSVTLKVKSGNDEDIYTKNLSPDNTMIGFEIEVNKGDVIFTTEINSNNGSVIYATNQKVKVEDDGFAVNFEPKLVNALLVVEPDSLVLFDYDGEYIGTLMINNKGTKELSWEIGELTSVINQCQDSCLIFNPEEGSLLPGELDTVQVTGWLVTPYDGFQVTVNSNVGLLKTYVQTPYGYHFPDLIVRSFEITGEPSINSENQCEVQARAVVKNVGFADAGVFSMTALCSYEGTSTTYTVYFTVPGQKSYNYPYTYAELAPQDSITFEGKLVFSATIHNTTVTIWIVADECGCEGPYGCDCDVKELDAFNNESSPVSIFLP